MASIDQIKQLREETGLSISECKRALEAAGGDIAKVKEYLRNLGKELAEKKQTREVREGFLEVYVHPTHKLGAMVDVRCETDFVARAPDFRNFCHEIALQIASMNPQNVEELLKQPYVRDPSRQVQNLLQEAIAKLGENIMIQRFIRFEI